MLYIDLFLSFVLFIVGILSLAIKKFRTNIWIIILSLTFYPVAVITYYFPDLNRVIFGNISILDAVVYPFVKILIILSMIQCLFDLKENKT